MAKKGSLEGPSKPQEPKPAGAKKKPVVNEMVKIFAGKMRKVQGQGKSSDGVNQNNGSSSKKKKPMNEIDLIFAGKKRKKPQEDGVNQNESKKTEMSDKGKKKKRSLEEEERRFAGTPGKSGRRKTADGLTIYTEEELGLSKSEAGGGSSLCPFDCDCCF